MSPENAITTTNANEIDVHRNDRSSSRNHGSMTQMWTYRPDADTIEQSDHYQISLDMPGVSSEDVDVSIDREVLTIHGRVHHDRTNGGRRWMRQEYGVGDYFRRFQLDETVNIDAITASCRDGVLTLTMPKHEAARPKRITVSSSDGK